MSGELKQDGSISINTSSSAFSSPSPRRRNIVFPDPVAFRYLAEDSSVHLVKSRGELCGYEVYLVEQWACSRQSATLVIVTDTGDPKRSIVVGVLSVPADEKDWSPRLKVYFKAVQKYHARPKETELGELMVANLSSFPSALTMISVPDGDIKKHRQSFIVNEDLKRMRCSGRSGMSLTGPTPATQAKFYTTYKIHEKVPFFEAVMELVKLCQVALFIFGILDPEFIDGLLCDMTETAIGNWWTEVGSECYNMEPTDGILGPTTVAALLGMLIGARNRLSSYGVTIAKDVFDIDSTKRAIGHFQKSQKLEKSRRLDRQTLLQLHKVTAKAAAGEEWGVQKAIGATVSQFGKRGELLSGVIGTREKAGIGDVETVDIDKFKGLVYGERAKWLWLGKQCKSILEHHERSKTEVSNMLLFGKEEEKEKERDGKDKDREKEKKRQRERGRDREREREKEKEAERPSLSQSHSSPRQSSPLEDFESMMQTEEPPNTIYSMPTPGSTLSMTESPGGEQGRHKAVFRSVAGRVSDARSRLGRIGDAVGGNRKGHISRPPRDEVPETEYTSPTTGSLVQFSSTVSSPNVSGRAFTWKNKPEEYSNVFQRKNPDFVQSVIESDQPFRTISETVTPELQEAQNYVADALEIRKDLAHDVSVAPSTVDDSDLQGPFLQAERNGDATFSFLCRRHSIAAPEDPIDRPLNESRCPRCMSFGAISEVILRWDEITSLDDKPTTIEEYHASAELAQNLHSHMAALSKSLSPWLLSQVDNVESLEETYATQQETLQQVYYALSDELRRTKQNSAEMIAEERIRTTEANKDVEVQVAKLEYEISALLSKVKDVEDGIVGFEGSVEDLESRAEELKDQLETEGWFHWAVRTFTGIGTSPYITTEG